MTHATHPEGIIGRQQGRQAGACDATCAQQAKGRRGLWGVLCTQGEAQGRRFESRARGVGTPTPRDKLEFRSCPTDWVVRVGAGEGHIALCSNEMGPANGLQLRNTGRERGWGGMLELHARVGPIRSDSMSPPLLLIEEQVKVYLPRGRVASVSGVTSAGPHRALRGQT